MDSGRLAMLDVRFHTEPRDASSADAQAATVQQMMPDESEIEDRWRRAEARRIRRMMVFSVGLWVGFLGHLDITLSLTEWRRPMVSRRFDWVELALGPLTIYAEAL